MGNEPLDVDDLDLSKFELPTEFWHETQRGDGPTVTDRFGIDAINSQRWKYWVVKLEFKKSGIIKYGNGFLVNIPNAAYEVILTAGHNLVDKPRKYCSDIKIIRVQESKDETPVQPTTIPVNPGMIRVCQQYFEDPDELHAVYDYGIILLERDQKQPCGFGFNLMLGLTPPSGDVASTADAKRDVLQDSLLRVSGYMPQDSPGKSSPRRSEGRCTRTGLYELEYKAHTMQGMSGGPVWLGYRGTETVVAIHNYGAKTDNDGNRGSRLNLKVYRTIFGWLGIGWYGKSLHYLAPPPHSIYSMHLHLPPPAASGKVASEGRVRVGMPGRVETLFDVLPAAALPNAKHSEASYGFLQLEAPSSENVETAADTSPPRWVRWDPKKNKVLTTEVFDASCEVKLLNVVSQPGRPFKIQVQDVGSFKQVQMSMDRLDEGDLEPLRDDPQAFEDTSEVSFVSISNKKLFEFR